MFDSLFVIFSNDKKTLMRVGGTAFNTLEVSTFFRLDSPTFLSYMTYGPPTTAKTVSGSVIEGICSMDFHGLFL